MFGAIVLLSATISSRMAAVSPQPWSPTIHAAECWETRCQRDAWPVKGCGQYGMAETKRVPCAIGGGAGGHVYTCCRPTNASEPSRPSHLRSCHGGTAECRLTAAVVGSRPFDGCRAYDTTGVQSPCTDGYQYVCCADNAHDDDEVERTKSGRMTFFHLGMTACGKKYCDRDMVGAVGPAYFSSSNPQDDSVCGKKVKIVDPVTSKSVVVKIVDKCGGCSKYDINVSPAAFKKIKPLSNSMTAVKWAFVY